MMSSAAKVLVAAFAFGTWAIPASATDWLGIYFDEHGNSNCLIDTPFVPDHAYVIYSAPSVAEITGYEFGVAIQCTLPILSAVATGAGAIADLSQVVVVAASPIACGDVTLLLDIEFMSLYNSCFLYLAEAAQPRVPGAGPIVIDGNQVVVPLSFESPSAAINGGMEICEGLADQPTTWGTMKSLFR